MIEYVTDMSYLQYLDPDRKQTLNMSFMESTVRIDDAKYDIFEVYDEWQ